MFPDENCRRWKVAPMREVAGDGENVAGEEWKA
jgi:hypothetical protein